MRDEENQRVTVRRLPDGSPHTAFFQSLNGRLLSLSGASEKSELNLKVGDLVEIAGPRHLYLGEVSVSRPENLVIGVEHVLDREALSRIQQVWQGPAGN